MLLGVPGIKPDRMIHRFLKDAAGHAFTNAYAEQVLRAVAAHFGVQAHELDHAVWWYQRRQPTAVYCLKWVVAAMPLPVTESSRRR